MTSSTAIAVAISIAFGAAGGAGATSIAISYASTPHTCDVTKPDLPVQRVPTTGSKSF